MAKSNIIIARGFCSNPKVFSSPYDPDAQAFITASGISDSNQKNAIDALVTSIKAAGIWSKMAAIYPMIGGTASTHKWNLKDPRDLDAAYRLVFTGGWTHASTGAKPNGSTGYANTFCVPSTVFTTSSAAIGYYSRTTLTETGSDMGAESGSGTSRVSMYMKWTDLVGYYYAFNDTAAFITVSNANAITTRLHVLSRTSPTLLTAYRNGTSLGTSTNASIGTIPTHPIYLGATNSSSTSFFDPASKECAFAFISGGLSGAEVTALTNAVETYQMILGRSLAGTTSSTTTTSTTIGPESPAMMKVVKAVANDVVEIATYDEAGVRIDFHSPKGGGATWATALQSTELYDITVTLTPSGRASAPISIVDGNGVTRASTGAGTTLSATNVDSNTVGITINIGS